MRNPPGLEGGDEDPVGEDDDSGVGEDDEDENYSRDSGNNEADGADLPMFTVRSCMKNKAVSYDITKRQGLEPNAVNFRLSCGH
jgi:hypothetical protein